MSGLADIEPLTYLVMPRARPRHYPDESWRGGDCTSRSCGLTGIGISLPEQQGPRANKAVRGTATAPGTWLARCVVRISALGPSSEFALGDDLDPPLPLIAGSANAQAAWDKFGSGDNTWHIGNTSNTARFYSSEASPSVPASQHSAGEPRHRHWAPSIIPRHGMNHAPLRLVIDK